METRQVKFLRTVTIGEVEHLTGEVYELGAAEAMNQVARLNNAEWFAPRRPCPTNAEFLSQFDPPYLRGRERA